MVVNFLMLGLEGEEEDVQKCHRSEAWPKCGFFGIHQDGCSGISLDSDVSRDRIHPHHEGTELSHLFVHLRDFR